MIDSGINLGQPINWSHPLNRGLVGWWLALPNWNRGYTWRDLCGRSHGTLTNMDAGTDWVTSTRGFGAVDFDGTNDRVATTLGYAVSPLSATAWIYPRTFGGVSKGRIFDANQGIWFIDNSGDGGLAFNTMMYVANGANTGTFSPANIITANVWQHVALTYDGTTAQHYVNGINVGSQSPPAGSAATGLNIGGRSIDNNRNFDGMIDDVRIFDYVMSPETVQGIYVDSLAGYAKTLNRISIPLAKAPGVGGGATIPIFVHHYRMQGAA